MGNWKSLRLKGARIGAASLIPIVLTAAYFPIVKLLGEREMPVIALTWFCSVFFPAAVVGCVYSVVFESAKLFGMGGLALAAVAVTIQPLTLYFAILGAFWWPAGAGIIIAAAAIRAYRRRHHTRRNLPTQV